jgi:hypothetical protein
MCRIAYRCLIETPDLDFNVSVAIAERAEIAIAAEPN